MNSRALPTLDLHHPPCLRFFTNQAFYACGQLAHLLLCAVQDYLLPPSAVPNFPAHG
ncbi:MAG: hypothetical protein RRA94_07165 [Bacteroidota bacterium]|nr:hypothetical protein [Bacteroidota bacterium]